MEHIQQLDDKITARKQELQTINQQIDAIDTQIDELKLKYPKVITPPSAAAKDYLEQAVKSDWSNDDVEVTGEISETATSLYLLNLTQREKLAERITELKLEVADLAFKLIKMNEMNSKEYDRNTVTSGIEEREKKVNEANKKMNDSDSTKVYFSFSSARSDFQKYPSAALLGSVALMKAEEVINKRMKYKDLVNQLKDEFNDGLDTQTREMIQTAYRDLVTQKDDLMRQKGN